MAKKKAAKGGAKKSTEILIVGSKMKDAIRSSGCNVAGDAIEHLNAKVHAILADAVKRAQDNGRKTVRGYDF
jgi:histone H3/H4